MNNPDRQTEREKPSTGRLLHPFSLFALHNRATLLRQRTHTYARTHTRTHTQTHTQTHTHIHKELHTLSLSPSLSMSLSPKVLPLPKTNDSSDPSNYRPISSLPVIPKRLERHIHKDLVQYLENNKLIHQYQIRFRPNYSCHTTLTRLCDSWLSAINCSETFGTLFLDFMKAFDLHERLSLYAKDSSPLTFFILILQTGHNFFFLTTSHLQRDWWDVGFLKVLWSGHSRSAYSAMAYHYTYETIK